MIQNGMQNGFSMNPAQTQPGGMLYNQNMIPGNSFGGTNGNQMPNNMIMATPVITNNQPQIQNQGQTNQGNYQQTYIPGRFVNSPEEIGVIEVPMNSVMAVFPKPDRTEIYVKYWTEQGVQSETFVRKEPEYPSITASESTILQTLNSVMERLGKLEANQQTKNTTKKTNKEEVI